MIDESKLIEFIKSDDFSKRIFQSKDSLRNIFIQLIEEQPKICEWIPCSERLPKEKGEYLVTCDDGSICIWWFVIENDLKLWATMPYSCKPIAWMSLPEPFKG